MREILFRGKRVDNGEWVEGNLFIPDKVARVDVPTEILMGTNIVRISYEVDPETVGQYTGLKDKNGKRIFEGDVCLCNRNIAPSVDGQYFEIRFDVDEGQWYGCGWISCIEANQFGMCEIIDNIHDNPELLKEA